MHVWVCMLCCLGIEHIFCFTCSCYSYVMLLAARIWCSVFAVPFAQMAEPSFQRLPLIQSNASHMTSTACRLWIWFFRTSVCSYHLWHGQILAELQVEAAVVEVTYKRTATVFYTKVTNKLAQAEVLWTCVGRWAFWLLVRIPAILVEGFCSFPQPLHGDARMVSSLYSFMVYLVVLSVFQTV